ncbi:MAG TPA: DEAD/DEAH box helicase, partial [Agromyces sp.]
MTRALDSFAPSTRAWFTESFREPTAVQDAAWRAISRGDHALVVAPTGSGKTLAAFLSAIDRLHHAPPPVVDAATGEVADGAPRATR